MLFDYEIDTKKPKIKLYKEKVYPVTFFLGEYNKDIHVKNYNHLAQPKISLVGFDKDKPIAGMFK